MAKRITLAVFCGIIGFGIVLALVGVMLGGSTGNFGYDNGQIVYHEGDQQVQVAQAPHWANRLVSRITNGHWGSDTAITAVTAQTPLAEETPMPFSASELKKLNIDVGAGYVIVQPGEDFGLLVDGPMKYTSSFENGEWNFTANAPNNISVRNGNGRTEYWHNNENITTTFTFTVPFDFDALDVDMDMGEAHVGGLTLKKLDCSTEMGAIALSEISTGTSTLKTSMGAIDATGFFSGDTELKCEMGAINLEGSLSGKVTAQCDMGAIYAYLDEPDDYGWQAEADMGSATVGGHSAAGIGSKSSGGNASASTFFDLDCGMGSIDIEFY